MKTHHPLTCPCERLLKRIIIKARPSRWLLVLGGGAVSLLHDPISRQEVGSKGRWRGGRYGPKREGRRGVTFQVYGNGKLGKERERSENIDDF